MLRTILITIFVLTLNGVAAVNDELFIPMHGDGQAYAGMVGDLQFGNFYIYEPPTPSPPGPGSPGGSPAVTPGLVMCESGFVRLANGSCVLAQETIIAEEIMETEGLDMMLLVVAIGVLAFIFVMYRRENYRRRALE